MRAGTSFGEVALMHNVLRTAAVQCSRSSRCAAGTGDDEPGGLLLVLSNRRFRVLARMVENAQRAHGGAALAKTPAQRALILGALKNYQGVRKSGALRSFPMLSPQEQRMCMDCFRLREVVRGQKLIQQGEVGREFFILASGDFDIEESGSS